MNNIKYNKLSLIPMIFLLIIVGCTSKQPENSAKLESSYYTCPMHPEVVQDEEGDCPICGMELVVRQASSETKNEQGYDNSKTITIDPTVVQNMGIRVQHISYRDISHNIRTTGKVEIAEDESYSVNLRFSGWIEKIYADKTGQKVLKGDKLFEIYSPELIAAQEEYLLSVNTYGKDSKISKAAEKKLLLWNIPNRHLEKIISANDAQQNMIFVSPFSGHIIHKNIKEGSKVKAGMDLYHISNLDKIWIIADIYELDAPFVQEGQNVTLELTNLQGKTRTGKIAFIYPTLDPKTRTQRIRIELENPNLSLKPGMFANVTIEVNQLNDVLTVPAEAIINTGERKIVFLSRGNGKFESREILTGLTDESEYYTEVISGLEKDEVVVVSGQFLLDSESQLQEAVQKLRDAKFSSNSNSDNEQNHSHDAISFFTCPMHPTIVQEEAGDCPICGMDLVQKES
ncbi:MAG: efflux RND transporter periplasmic adaptor subunit [Candidatus Celaenobacter polaris]|nr:efflux RND transporter periplasmic adaptor subunit [Candidatus Celaenobacter polaris]